MDGPFKSTAAWRVFSTAFFTLTLVGLFALYPPCRLWPLTTCLGAAVVTYLAFGEPRKTAIRRMPAWLRAALWLLVCSSLDLLHRDWFLPFLGSWRIPVLLVAVLGGAAILGAEFIVFTVARREESERVSVLGLADEPTRVPPDKTS